MQPGIHVYAASERFETMVRDDKKKRVVIDLVHHPTDQGVHAGIQVFNHSWALIFGHVSGGWMIVFQVAPEHVLYAVGGVEDAGAEALLGFFQGVEQPALAVVVVGVALGEERVIVKDLLVERPGVFGK